MINEVLKKKIVCFFPKSLIDVVKYWKVKALIDLK